ncbi:MAG: VanW family protein, partial [Eubacterium sp.]|nr:VanW family protein [Eubacterium sp.]
MKKKLSLSISVLLLSFLCLLSFSVYADETDVLELNKENTSASTYYKEYQYVGKAITPALTVKYNGKKLVKDVDYTVKYSNNVNAGNAKAVITGIGKYSGSYTKIYKIVPVKDSKDLKFSPKHSTVSYTGKAKTPGIVITYKNKTLTKNKDYKISYSSNINIGTAKMTVKGIGNFSFNKTFNFKIVPAEVKGLKFSPTANSITLSWKKASNVTGYQIMEYDYNKKAYKTVKFVSAATTSYTIKGLDPSCLYKYNIRAYRKIGDTTYYGVYTKELMTRTRSANTTMRYVAINGNNLYASWNTVRGAGYVLIYATNSRFTDAKEIYINDSRTGSYTIKNINRNKSYYVKVCPFTTLNGKKYFSGKSAYISTDYSKRLAVTSSYYVNNANRTTNLRLAANAINGTIILPGETFSFNKTVGQRTYAKGYKDAPVFTGPDAKNVENGIGGGICQVASTM